MIPLLSSQSCSCYLYSLSEEGDLWPLLPLFSQYYLVLSCQPGLAMMLKGWGNVLGIYVELRGWLPDLISWICIGTIYWTSGIFQKALAPVTETVWQAGPQAFKAHSGVNWLPTATEQIEAGVLSVPMQASIEVSVVGLAWLGPRDSRRASQTWAYSDSEVNNPRSSSWSASEWLHSLRRG